MAQCHLQMWACSSYMELLMNWTNFSWLMTFLPELSSVTSFEYRITYLLANKPSDVNIEIDLITLLSQAKSDVFQNKITFFWFHLFCYRFKQTSIGQTRLIKFIKYFISSRQYIWKLGNHRPSGQSELEQVKGNEGPHTHTTYVGE